jgi:hypothetical protein
MYEVHFLVMLMHVETHLGDVMVHGLWHIFWYLVEAYHE